MPQPLCSFVDLGLPSGLKWATCNVGAEKPEDSGLYFAWGEIQGYTAEDIKNGLKHFTWGDYQYTSGAYTEITDTTFRGGITKYNNNSNNGTVDNLTTLESVDDAAYATDNTCRMPTKADFEELTANTTSTWETLNGVSGMRFTSNINGNSILIPWAYTYEYGMIFADGFKIYSSSIDENDNTKAYVFCQATSGDNNNKIVAIYRYSGFNIRPVKE